MSEQTSTGRAMCAEETARNEQLEAENARLHRRIKNMAADINERLDWIVRDKRESDKVLSGVTTARSVLIRYVLLSPASDEEGNDD